MQQGAGAYIIGEKLRPESPHVKAALSRQGRYLQVAGNLQVKEVQITDAADRFVICYIPGADLLPPRPTAPAAIGSVHSSLLARPQSRRVRRPVIRVGVIRR